MGNDSKNSKFAIRPSQALGHSEFDPVRESKRSVADSQRDAMFSRLQEILMDGLRHGFFSCRVTCELVKDRKRRVVIEAGKSHQFTIREEDLHN